MKDIIIDYMIENKIPLTIRNYIVINTFGDCHRIEELGPEDRADLESLIENGLLVDTDNDWRM
jgi:hypothetical protein